MTDAASVRMTAASVVLAPLSRVMLVAVQTQTERSKKPGMPPAQAVA